jgi:hypothetical protein
MALMVDVRADNPAPETTPTSLSGRGQGLPAQNATFAGLDPCPDLRDSAEDRNASALKLPVYNTSPKEHLRANPSAQAGKGASTFLWAVLGLVFASMILVIPLVMACLGDAASVRYLIRLGGTLGVVGVLVGLAGLACLFSRRAS